MTIPALPTQTTSATACDATEQSAFLTQQLITYIGNKRALLPLIDHVVSLAQNTIGHKLRVVDLFSGSGAVSRRLKHRAEHLVANDLEGYAKVMSSCFLRNHDDVDVAAVAQTITELNELVDAGLNVHGFVEQLYAPCDDADIQPGERVFYTRDNARRIDAYRALIAEQPEAIQDLLLGPLLAAASVHANTSGVFKGFHKDRATGCGKFGGSKGDALGRIKGTIRLQPPVLSRFSCVTEVFQQDANALARQLPPADVVYLDPPYNQHPYGSNYFMLNLITENQAPTQVSPVSGIPRQWNRSGYNVKRHAGELMRDLVTTLDARFLVVSFNDEGFIAPAAMLDLLTGVGTVQEFTTEYHTFRGSRNLKGRNKHVTEHVYLVEKR